MVLRFGIQGALVLSSFSPVSSPSVPCRGHGRLRHIRSFKVLFGSLTKKTAHLAAQARIQGLGNRLRIESFRSLA